MRRIGWVLATVALVAAALFAPSTSRPAYPALSASDAHFLVIAHRGFSGVAPENTVPAMRAAIAVHASDVELDVQRTKDGHLVVLHDLTLARTTNIAHVFPGRQHDPIGTFTLAQVERLDAGSWMGPRFAGTRVPTLGQVLDVIAPSRTNLMLELKNPTYYPGYESQVAHALAAHHLGANRVEVHSFSPASLHRFHRFAPAYPLSLLVDRPRPNPRGYRWVQAVEPKVGAFGEGFVDRAHADHLQVYAWDSSSPPQMEQLADWGVNGVTTDRPDVADTELRSHP